VRLNPLRALRHHGFRRKSTHRQHLPRTINSDHFPKLRTSTHTHKRGHNLSPTTQPQVHSSINPQSQLLSKETSSIIPNPQSTRIANSANPPQPDLQHIAQPSLNLYIGFASYYGTRSRKPISSSISPNSIIPPSHRTSDPQISRQHKASQGSPINSQHQQPNQNHSRSKSSLPCLQSPHFPYSPSSPSFLISTRQQHTRSRRFQSACRTPRRLRRNHKLCRGTVRAAMALARLVEKARRENER
jgi:hypothetical protein